MGITISGDDAAGYVSGTPHPDTGLTVDDAIYHSVHNYPGGVAALAVRMGLPVGTLTHKANPNNTTHYLRPSELVAMMLFTGNASALRALAATIGYTVQRVSPDQTGGSSVEAIMRMTVAYSDFVRAVADPLARMEADATTWPTAHEIRRAEYMAAALHSEADHMLATLRAHKRYEPKESNHA